MSRPPPPPGYPWRGGVPPQQNPVGGGGYRPGDVVRCHANHRQLQGSSPPQRAPSTQATSMPGRSEMLAHQMAQMQLPRSSSSHDRITGSGSPSPSKSSGQLLAPMLGFPVSRSADASPSLPSVTLPSERSSSLDGGPRSAGSSPTRQHPPSLTPGVRPWDVSVVSSSNSPGHRMKANANVRHEPPPRLPESIARAAAAAAAAGPLSRLELYDASKRASMPVFPAAVVAGSPRTERLPQPSFVAGHRRAQSVELEPPRSSAAAGAVRNENDKAQCAGVKKNGQRCTRMVGAVEKGSKGKLMANPWGEDDMEDYCFQHAAEINKTAGFNLPGNGVYVAFGDFIPAHLSPRAKARLRTTMTKAATEMDRAEKGYLYIYQLRDRATAQEECFKVGRSINVFKRIDEWRSRCQSKEPLLRAFLPAPEGQLLLSGAASATSIPGFALSRKWERLCHLELEEIATRVDEECRDCGSRHREMFMVPKKAGSSNDSYESVHRIVRRWMRFVQLAAESQRATGR